MWSWLSQSGTSAPGTARVRGSWAGPGSGAACPGREGRPSRGWGAAPLPLLAPSAPQHPGGRTQGQRVGPGRAVPDAGVRCERLPGPRDRVAQRWAAGRCPPGRPNCRWGVDRFPRVPSCGGRCDRCLQQCSGAQGRGRVRSPVPVTDRLPLASSAQIPGVGSHRLRNGARALHFPAIQESDSGLYSCRAENQAGAAQRDFALLVLSE